MNVELSSSYVCNIKKVPVLKGEILPKITQKIQSNEQIT